MGIPILLRQRRYETGDAEMNIDDLFNENNIKKLTLRTVLNWMHCLGFEYCVIRKSFYVDGHETPQNVKERMEYILQYFQDEFRCHRWLQFTETEIEDIIKKK